MLLLLDYHCYYYYYYYYFFFHWLYSDILLATSTTKQYKYDFYEHDYHHYRHETYSVLLKANPRPASTRPAPLPCCPLGHRPRHLPPLPPTCHTSPSPTYGYDLHMTRM